MATTRIPCFYWGTLSHVEDDYNSAPIRSRAISEAYAVDEANYYRSVYGHKNFQKDYDFGTWDKITGNNEQEEFKEWLNPSPNPTGESVKFTGRRIAGDIKIDAKNSYIVTSVMTYNSDAKEVSEAKDAIVYYFDYKKDRNSKTEKKAVVISISVANEENK